MLRVGFFQYEGDGKKMWTSRNDTAVRFTVGSYRLCLRVECGPGFSEVEGGDVGRWCLVFDMGRKTPR